MHLTASDMKFILQLLLILFIVSSVVGQIPADLKTFELSGQVKFLKVSKASFAMKKGKLVAGKLRLWEQTNFDEHGYYTDRINLDGNYARPWKNKYDSQ